MHNKNLNKILEEELIDYLEKSSIENAIPIIQLLYHTYLMLKMPEGKPHFIEVLKLNAMYGQFLSHLQRLNTYTALQNFCIRQMNTKGDLSYERQLFDICKEQLTLGLLTNEENNIQPSTFKNVVNLSLRLAEYEWAAHFIENYAEKLRADKRTEVENQAKALYAFATAQYKQTLKILQNTEPVDIFFKIDAKRLVIRTYYELREEELALSSLNTFRVFVHRDSIISESHKLTNRNFANILTKIIQTDKKPKLAKLQTELKEMPSVADRKWLAEKIEMRLAAM